MASRRAFRLWLLVSVAFLLGTSAASAVGIDWVTVGDAGNACDPQAGGLSGGPGGCFGAVADEYRIGKFEVSNAEYAEFLNAIAATDTNGLYGAVMGLGGMALITQAGSSGSFSYSAVAGRENRPVSYVTFYDSLRFANWLHNGQPTGAQDSTTTEDGAYDMSLGSSVVRKAGATAFLTSEDEWYKAAYYKGGGTNAGYWVYPAGSNTQNCTAPGATANTANCQGAVGDLTDRGSYTGSASPSGTFDQGGNVWERNEAIIGPPSRGMRGSSHSDLGLWLQAVNRFQIDPTSENFLTGFRVASTVPESPPVPSLSPFGITLLLGGLGIALYRKLHA
jgi:sulfatase modifying factor 1